MFFFFQAEDGIRDYRVTGVQTCALPIDRRRHTSELQSHDNLVCRLLRSEEHTSELQSHDNLVCRLLLEKKTNIAAERTPGCYRDMRTRKRPRVQFAALPFRLGEERLEVLLIFFFERRGCPRPKPCSPTGTNPD